MHQEYFFADLLEETKVNSVALKAPQFASEFVSEMDCPRALFGLLVSADHEILTAPLRFPLGVQILQVFFPMQQSLFLFPVRKVLPPGPADGSTT